MKTKAEEGVQLPETKVAAAAESNGTMGGPALMSTARPDHQKNGRKHDVTLVVMRLACVLSSVAALCLMVTAKERSTASMYGFSLPLYSKWSFADSFEYLVGVCAAVATHSVLQLLISTSRLLRKSPVILSRKHAWLIFAADQEMKNPNMASLFGHVFAIFVLLLSTIDSPVGALKEFKVGGAEGWQQPGVNDSAMYNQWAAMHRFHVGDSLRFQYKNDSVLVVDKYGYFHCNMTKPISTFKDGYTLVNIEKPGPMYVISGDPDHCKNGQRLEIEVMGLHPIARSPPSIANPPQSYMAVSPSPSSSSGDSVSVAIVAVSMGLVTSFVATYFMCAP